MNNITLKVQKGGGGGAPFQDSDNLINLGFISKIIVRHGNVVDSLRLFYGNSPGAQHGGGGGKEEEFLLEPGERIVRVEGRAGNVIDSLQFFTDRGKASPKYGGGGGTPFSAVAPDGGQLIMIEGRAGNVIDQVTLGFGPAYYITDFQYDIAKAVSNRVPQLIASQELSNHTDVEQTARYSQTVKVLTEKQFTFNSGQKIGAKAVFNTGIPILAEGQITVSAEVSFQQGVLDKSSQETIESWDIPVKVPGNTTIQATSTIQRNKLTVPFSYDLVWYKGNRTNEVARQTFTGTYEGVNVTDLKHDFR